MEATDGGSLRDVAVQPAMDLRFSFHFEQNDPLQLNLNALDTSAEMEKAPVQRKMPLQPFAAVDNVQREDGNDSHENHEDRLETEELNANEDSTMAKCEACIETQPGEKHVYEEQCSEHAQAKQEDEEKEAQAKDMMERKQDDKKEECNDPRLRDEEKDLVVHQSTCESHEKEDRRLPQDQCADGSKQEEKSPVEQCNGRNEDEVRFSQVNVACAAESKQEKNEKMMDQCNGENKDDEKESIDAKMVAEEKESKSYDGTTTDDATCAETIAPPPVPSNPYTIANMYPVKWEDTLPVKPSVNTLKKTVSSNKPSVKPSQTNKPSVKISQTNKPAPKSASLSQTAPAPRSKTHQKQLNTIQITHAAELTKLQVQLECITKERDCAIERYHRANSEMDQMTQNTQTLQLQAAKFQAEAEAYKAQCTTLQAMIEKEQGANEEMKKRVSSCQADLNQLKAKWCVGQGKITALEKEKALLLSKLDASKQENHRVQASLDTSTRRIQKLQTELTTQQTNHSSAVLKWKQKKEMLLHENKAQTMRVEKELGHELQTKLKTIEIQTDKKLRDAEDSNQVLRRKALQLESKLKDAHDQIRILELKLSTTKKQTTSKDTTKHLELEIQSLQRELAAVKQKQKQHTILTTKAKTPSKPKDLHDTAVQVDLLPQENNSLRLAELENEITTLKDKLIAQEQHVMSLRELHAKELKLQAQAYLLAKEK